MQLGRPSSHAQGNLINDFVSNLVIARCRLLLLQASMMQNANNNWRNNAASRQVQRR